jgi:hypothetical protein
LLQLALPDRETSTMNESHFEGLTTTPSSFGPKETMDWLEAEIRAKGMTVFGCIDHSAGKTWMSYDEPEFYHENIARYCSTHNYCSAGCSSR